MIDLTKITTPLGLLDEIYGPGTARAMRNHGGPYERWRHYEGWEDIEFPLFDPWRVYRVKPARKPSVDWSEVPKTVNFLALNDEGDLFAVFSQPQRGFESWFPQITSYGM